MYTITLHRHITQTNGCNLQNDILEDSCLKIRLSGPWISVQSCKGVALRVIEFCQMHMRVSINNKATYQSASFFGFLEVYNIH